MTALWREQLQDCMVREVSLCSEGLKRAVMICFKKRRARRWAKDALDSQEGCHGKEVGHLFSNALESGADR